MPRHLRFAFMLSFTSLLVALVPVPAATCHTFVLSNEGGGLITRVVTAWYGLDNLYQALGSIVANSNPSLSGIVTTNFLTALHSNPVSSPIFTTQLQNVSVGSQAIAISTDGTYQVVGITGAHTAARPGPVRW